MKYAIITPTFKPHFKFIDKYLESYNKFVQDKDQIEIIFTISEDENKSFQKVLKKYPDINYKVVFFEDLLKKYNINYTPDELLNKYKKFSFQTLKKFYTMLDSDADYFLVLDSESMWIKETKMVDLFNNFYKSPFLTYSSLANRQSITPFTTNVNLNVNYLLNNNCEKWFLENFVWFYDKKILKDLFEKYGSPIEMAKKVYQLGDQQKIESGVFEIELYQAYLYHNKEKYGYNFIDIDIMLKENLPANVLKKYLKDHQTRFKGNCGLLEHSLMLLNEQNYKILANIFKENSFNIIRCNNSSVKNVYLQEKFINIVNPSILAASQEHAFGVNNKFLYLFKNDKSFQRLKKHFNKFVSPILAILKWLSQILSIIYYFVLSLLTITKIITECLRINDDKK